MKIFAWAIDRLLRRPEEDFSDIVNEQEPLVKQVEDYARQHDFELQAGWKVEVAKLVKTRMLQNSDEIAASGEIVEKWKTLFERFCTTST